MNPAEQREEVVFEAALQLPADQRAGYLDMTCASDAELRRRVEVLLGAFERAGGFLKQPATPTRTVIFSLPPTEKAGDKIGRYKLLQQIGEGGCGVVYMAEQEEPVRRRVALKVIKLGMDTKSVIARFEAERQALALMDHPSIARVLDAGATDTGRPYFVMELVRGIKITEFCDQKQLSTRERLDLFVQVCQAIQHAHQKGIIHRDIKPSNILVTLRDGVPVPKVIDFGIAKATTDQRLTDKTLFTQFEMFIGTPAYMSPEQAEMSELGIDTRSDIYSLGILLYELLTGTTPFDARELMKAGLVEIRRIIREEEPARPSTRLTTMAVADLTDVARHRHAEPAKLSSLIRGDLDWIVMKCLEKDRGRRYETANGVATDIQRHLNCEPVVARPPSRLYELHKTVRRHKFGFAAGAALVTVLAVGVAVSTLEAVQARRAQREQARQRQIAVTKEKKSEQVAQFLKDMLQGVGPSVALGRDTTMLREILDKTAKRISQDLKAQPEVQIELTSTLADTYHELAQYKAMEEMAREGLRVARSSLGEENLAVADALGQLGDALMHLGDQGQAESVTRQAIAMERKLHGGGSQREADALYNLASVLRIEDKLEEAETAAREALALRKALLGAENLEVARCLLCLSMVLKREHRWVEAEAAAREALAMQKKLFGGENPEYARSFSALANILAEQGGLAEAETWYREALAMQRKMRSEDSPRVAMALEDLISVLRREGKLAEAEAVCRDELAIRRKLLGSEHLDVAATLGDLSFLLREESKLPEAETTAREALAIRKKLLGNEHNEVAQSLHLLAWNLNLQGKHAEAESLSREEVAMWRKLLGNDDPNVAWALGDLAIFLRDQKKLPEAETAIRESLATRRKRLGNTHPDTVNSFNLLVDLLRTQGKLAEAAMTAREVLLEYHTSLAQFEKLGADSNRHEESWSFAISYEALGGLLKDLGQTQEAEIAYRDTQVLWRKLVANFNTEDHRFHLAVNYDALGNLLRETGRAAESLAAFRDAQAVWLKLVAEFNQEDRRRHLGYTDDDIGQLLKEAGRFDEAAEAYRQALAVWRKLAAEFNKDDDRNRLSGTLVSLATALQSAGKRTEAKAMYREAGERGSASALNELAWAFATSSDSKLRDGTNAVVFAEKAVATTNRKNVSYLDTLAAAYAETGQFARAISVQQEAIALSQSEPEQKDLASKVKLYENNSPYRDHGAMAELTRDRLREGKFAEAEALARECLTIRETEIPDDWRTFNTRSMLGCALLGQKKYADAEPLLLAGYEGVKQREVKIPSEGKPRLKETLQRLVQLYEDTNRPDQAAAWKRKLAEFDKDGN